MNSEVKSMNVLCCYESWLLQAVEERKVSTKKIRFLVVFPFWALAEFLSCKLSSKKSINL